MNRKQFEQQRGPQWVRLKKILDGLDRRRGEPVDRQEMPRLHRRACRDLSLAQDRMYGLAMVDRINRLVRRGYRHLYRDRRLGLYDILDFIFVTFPRLVRANWHLLLLCTTTFVIPFLAMAFSIQDDPAWVHSVLGPKGMEEVEASYGHERIMSRDTDSNVAMFGLYIYNNVSIDFKTFAGGLLCGVGALFFLFFNGLHLGAFTGYVHEAASPENFWSFVSGHSSFELIGMLIAGMAGMKLGLAILKPGRMTRREALRVRGREGVRLLYGAATLTILAAFIEAFWSAQSLPPSIKYTVGASLWVLLIVYLGFSGRWHDA
ncbi:MAG: stage II sporulation protein M [Phycisphaeraceae bacterium]|nr:stage II sporulation protein M [Phycisphaeraceae bacterium]